MYKNISGSLLNDAVRVGATLDTKDVGIGFWVNYSRDFVHEVCVRVVFGPFRLSGGIDFGFVD